MLVGSSGPVGYGNPENPVNETPPAPCATTLGSCQTSSRDSRVWLTTASFVIEGLNTDTRLPLYDRPSDFSILGVGSATSLGAHQPPRGRTVSAGSREIRTNALVLLLTFQSTRIFSSWRFSGSSAL